MADELPDDAAEQFATDVFDAFRDEAVLLTQINMLSKDKYEWLDDVPREVLYNVLAMFLMAMAQMRLSNITDTQTALTDGSPSS